MTQSLDRALQLLLVVGTHPEGVSLTQLTAETSIPVSTVHRLLATLRSRSFVSQGPQSHLYFVGPAVLHLWESSHKAADLSLMIAPREMIDARDRTGETIFMSEFRDNNQVLCQCLVPSKHSLQLYVHVGQRMPLHAAAAARVLLAWRDEHEVAQLLQRTELTPFTPDTPRTVTAVLNHLRDVRTDGYDTCTSELDAHCWAVSFPVRTAIGEVVASVTLAAPMQRIQERHKEQEAIDTVRRTADALSRHLGWSGLSDQAGRTA